MKNLIVAVTVFVFALIAALLAVILQAVASYAGQINSALTSL